MNSVLELLKRKRGNKMAKAKELKEALGFICALANSIGKMAEKGKPTLSDMVHLAPLMYKIPSAVDGIDQVPQEMKELSEEDLKELVQMIKDDLELPQEKIEMALEASLDIALKLYALAQKLR